MWRWRPFVGLALAGLLLFSAENRAAEELQNGKRDAPATAESPKRDAISDPLLLLLRAPVIRKELGLREKQVESLEQAIGEVDEPLWRLRDVQFLSVENSEQSLATDRPGRFEARENSGAGSACSVSATCGAGPGARCPIVCRGD